MVNKNFLFLKKLLLLKIRIMFLIFLLTIKYSFQIECEKSLPIKKTDNKCYLIYCTKEQFEEKECIISNSVIKTQWLTNIIDVGIKNFRFINFALTTKNDLFLQTTAYPSTQGNIFFGLKSNGRPYFLIDEEETSVIILTYLDSSYFTRYNGELLNIIVEKRNKQKEYLLSIGKDENNFEIFDFKKALITVFPTKEMTEYLIRSKKFSFLHFIDNNNKNSYILVFIGKQTGKKNFYYVLQKYEFFYNKTLDDIDYKKIEYIKKENLDNNRYKYILSCFQTINKLIICFYYDSSLNYTATLYDSNLIEKNNFDFGKPSSNQDLFFKCIHLKQEIGIFYYFLGKNEKPKIDIVEFMKTSDGNNYTMEYVFRSLITKNDNVNYKMYYNSILKLNDNKFGIIQLSLNQEEIYIIIFNIYNDNKEIIGRYYKIDIFKLYNWTIHNDVESILFNSCFVSAFSFCTEKGSNNCTNFHSSVIMFSYPDSKDYKIDLIDFFKSNNNSFPLDRIIKKTKIDNNIFGYIIKGIQIQSYPKDKYNNDIISLFSNNNKRIININETIDKNDKIEFFFPQNIINDSQYTIEYACVVTEPDYDIYNSYCEIDSDNGNIIEEKKYFQKYEYIGKTGYILLDVEKELTNDCNNNNCSYCLKANKNNCVLYKKLDNKEEEELSDKNKEEDSNKNEEDISDKNEEDISNKNEEELSDKNEEDNSNKNEIKYLTNTYNKLIKMIYEKSFDAQKAVKCFGDFCLQLSSLEFEEKSINDENLTNIFLGKCIDILKEKYNLQDNELLLILKVDILKQNSFIGLFEYEIYNYNKSEKLNLDYCDNIKTNVYVPIKLDNKTIILYNHLNYSGYNLFEPNDPFYTDICSKYTTINGTDIALIDRKDYYNESLLLCKRDGCIYDYYNSKIKKVKCTCPISQTAKTENSITNQNDNNFINIIKEKYNGEKNFKPIFPLSIKNINFQVMKCYKLVFRKNYGNIPLYILIILYLVTLFIYIIGGNCRKCALIKKTIKNDSDKNEGKKEKLDKSVEIKNEKNYCPTPLCKNKAINNNINNSKTESVNNNPKNYQDEEAGPPASEREDSQNNENVDKSDGTKSVQLEMHEGENSRSHLEKQYNSFNYKKKIKSFFEIDKETIDGKDNNNNIIINNLSNEDSSQNINLSDEELNNLDYKKAIIKDRRKFNQYYWSLLKKNHLMLFTFFPSNDYNNIRIIKISFFILSLSLYMPINAFFLSDSIIIKIYKNNGEFILANQIKQIIFSTLVLIIINIFISIFLKRSSSFLKKIFLILGFLLMIFFWYFISTFCIIYSAAQKILIINSSISFVFSMITPFLYELIPGLCRILSLKATNHYCEFMYNLSRILAVI